MLVRRPADLALPDGVLALDTEFHTEKRYVPRLHLIQVRAPTGPAFLIDPHVPGLLEGVAPVLLGRPWIVHAGRVDLELLALALGGVPEVVLDTQIAAGLLSSRYPMSLERLLGEHLGVAIDKSETLSDWSQRPLAEAQLAYAAADVAHLHDLWAALDQKAEALGRADAVRDASATARREALEPRPLDDAWLDLPGRRPLTPERAVVLRELAAWREATARATNQPPGSVLGNHVLFDLAKRRPLTPEALLSGRRSPKAALTRYSDEILACVARASGSPAVAVPPTFPAGSVFEARLAWLEAYAVAHGLAESWSARLVLPGPALEAIAHGMQAADVLHGWQHRLAGAKLDAVLAGEGGIPCPRIP
ncbi:MAG: HRDC domain-containing protein [Myxococcota bacterium]